MLLRRPAVFELEIDPPTDYQSALVALSLAALREQETQIRRVERTRNIRRFEEFLATGGIGVQWGERAVAVEPGEPKPFDFVNETADYDAFTYMLVLAATRTESRVRKIAEIDNTVEMLILALRRAGAEFEEPEEQPGIIRVRKSIDRAIKYQLRKESAKITPQLVTALSTISETSEISDLFDWGRFDYIFERMVRDFQRQVIQEAEPEDELEKRLRKKMQSQKEHLSHVLVGGGLSDEMSTIDLKPDTEFAAYLAAGATNHPQGKLVLRNFHIDDIAHTPLSQIKRMGADLKPSYSDGTYRLTVTPTALKSRRIGYEQLHAFPDAVGALALASAPLDATTVIRSAPYSTLREEERRRRLCGVIKSLGARVAEISDGVVLEGKKELNAEHVESGGDPFSVLTAASACLGPVESIEIDDVTAAESRWGRAFQTLLNLLQ